MALPCDVNRKWALWFPQGQLEAPSGGTFKLRPGYVFETVFSRSVDSESGFVTRDLDASSPKPVSFRLRGSQMMLTCQHLVRGKKHTLVRRAVA